MYLSKQRYLMYAGRCSHAHHHHQTHRYVPTRVQVHVVQQKIQKDRLLLGNQAGSYRDSTYIYTLHTYIHTSYIGIKASMIIMMLIMMTMTMTSQVHTVGTVAISSMIARPLIQEVHVPVCFMKLGGSGPQMVSIFHLHLKKRKEKKNTPQLKDYYYLRYIQVHTWCMYPLATSRSGLVLEIITYLIGSQMQVVTLPYLLL